MTLLANRLQDLRDCYGVIVVGSGYGGAIVAARLAEAGHDVCILERGKEWSVGDFPDEEPEVLRELRSKHNPLGLFDFVGGLDVDVVVGNGLGGTSLINANVAIAPEPAVFASARWPLGIQREAAAGSLDEYTARAREMLKVTEAAPPQGWPLKVQALSKCSRVVGAPHAPVPLAVNYDTYDGKPNHVGVTQYRCTHCGDCVTGCNVGAKNTLPMNYLPFAKQHGAHIHCGVEVEFVVRAGEEGYFVYVRQHEAEGAERVLHARKVILGAGALGSTGILLRSRERGLALSARLGHFFSGNADVIGIGYNTDQPTNVMGFGDHTDRAWFDVGPTIQSRIDFRSAERPLSDHFIIEEAAVPRALVHLMRTAGAKLSALTGRDTDAGFVDKAREVSRMVRDQVGYDPKGAANHSMLYLGIGHDAANGQVVLDHLNNPRVIWGEAGELPVNTRINGQMYELTAALGGTHIDNPRGSSVLGDNTMTVHPLGGCAMADAASDGVVDEYGQVFSDAGLHPGLFVADGSIVPTSLGVNPLLCICTLAERIAEHLVTNEPSKITPLTARPALPSLPALPLGMEMTEELRGYYTPDIRDAKTPAEFASAEKLGKACATELNFRVTIIIDDVKRFVETREHAAPCFGYVECPLFGGRRRVENGVFNMFVADAIQHMKLLCYRLEFYGADGQAYLLDGLKEVRDDAGFDAVSDMTTLYTSIRKGWAPDAPIVGQGIVRVTFKGLLEQIGSLRARNHPNTAAGARALGRFGRFMFGELWESFVVDKLP